MTWNFFYYEHWTDKQKYFYVSLMTKSKKLIFSFDFSYVNLRLGWNPLRSFGNLIMFSSEFAQIEKTCNWTRTQNHLIRKRTLNHLAKLVFIYS